MASRSLGTLTLSLVAQIGGFEAGMSKAARVSEKRMKEIEATAKKVGLAVGAAFSTAVVGLGAFLKSQAETISGYQDIAEKIGDTAEAVASLKAASDVSETSLDEVAAASVKLTAALSKTDDEAKGVGKALAAMGINLDDFKKLSPVEQIEAVAKALSGMSNAADQTALAVAVFGKSGADLLPFLHDLADGAERQTGLTKAQIEAADEFSKSISRLQGQASNLSQQFAAELLPVGRDVLKVFEDLLKEVKSYAGDNSIKEFAQSTALAFATVGEAVFGLIKLLNAVRGSFQSVIADSKVLARLNPLGAAQGLFSDESFGQLLDERNRIAEEANDRYQDLWNYNGTAVSDALRKSFESQKDYVDKARALVDEVTGFLPKPIDAGGMIPFRPGKGPGSKPDPKIDGVPDSAVRSTKAATDAMKDYEFEVLKAIDAEDTERRTARQDALNQKIADAKSVFQSTRTPLENFNAELAHLNELRDTFVDGKPLIDDVTYRRRIVAMQDDLHGLAKETEEVTSEMTVFWEEASRNMQDIFANFLVDPFKDGLAGMLDSFADMLQQMAAQAAAAQIFKAFSAGLTGSGGFLDLLLGIGGGLGGGGPPIGKPKALGGPVTPGTAYLVGENGPEMFMPNSVGNIIPNGQGMVSVTNHFTIQAPSGSVTRQTQDQIAQSVGRAVANAQRRNG